MALAWKEYYAEERRQRKDQIIAVAKTHWQHPAASKNMHDIIESGGVLSFPHTFLDDSMMPIMHTIHTIYKAKKSKVFAVGVLHGERKQEFSLDGLTTIAKLYAQANNLTPLSFTEIYHSISVKDTEKRDKDIRLLTKKAKSLKSELDSDTAIVMTGDLVHFGYGYGDKNLHPHDRPLHDRLPNIFLQIIDLLDTIYKARDPLLFIEKSLAVKNDQIAPAIFVNALFDSRVSYSIFSYTLSDYSSILKFPPPTVVASLHYGVYPVK